MLTPLKGPKSRVSRLEVENFKSYRGKQQVGPFHAFTAVIGPNGSGKSNIMDAVSFVLGVKGAQIRGSLKELLYSYTEGQETIRPDTGYVKLIMEVEGQDDTVFQRSIILNQSSETYTSHYAIDDRTVTWATYEDKLKGFGILVKARNFLVFQGDIEAVASKQPLELTKLFESISGSDAFKANYEKYDAERKAAQEKLAFIQSKKRNTAAEKRQKKEQKLEAERHVKLQEQLETLKQNYYLWQLYHSQMDAHEAEAELESQQGKLREAAKQLKAIESTVKEKKREIAGLAKAKTSMDQKAKKRRAEEGKNNPEQVRVNVELERTQKKVKEKERHLKEERNKHAMSQDVLQKLKERLAILEEGELQRQSEPTTMQKKLNQDILEEYYPLKELAKSRTRKALNDKNALQPLQDMDKRALEDCEHSIASIDNQLEKMRATSQAQRDRLAEQEAELEASRSELQRLENLENHSGFQGRQLEYSRKRLEDKIEEINEKLQDFKAFEKETERDRKQREHIGRMKELFQGVHGRLAELGRVTQQSYSQALSVVMGNNTDSIVVDTEAVAKDCIQYLRQNHFHPMTFIPLRTVKSHPPHERLRTLGGSAKLAVDLVAFDIRFERAFHLACGNTLVCDTEQEARHLAFGRNGERHRVVTKDGLLISKGGAMTGGAAVEKSGTGFGRAQFEQLKEERQRYEQELNSLPDWHKFQSDKAKLLSQTNQLKARIGPLEAAVQRQQNLGNSSEREQPLLAEREKQLERLEKVRAEIEQRQAKMDSIQERIDKAEDDILADLSKKAGVEKLRVYLTANQDELKKQQADTKSYRIEKSKIESQLSYEQKKDFQKTLANIEAELQKHKDSLVELQNEAEKIAKAAAKRESQSKAETDKLKELRQKIEEGEAELKELRNSETEQIGVGKKVHQEVQRLEAALEALALTQSEILKTAQLEQVELPRHKDEMDPMETDNAAANTANYMASLNFDGLSRAQKGVRDAAEREKIDTEFTSSIDEQQAELGKVLPNLKAVEQYEEAKFPQSRALVQEKDDREKAELESARQVTKESSNAFHEVRQQRADAYMKAFDHVKDVIGDIYKELTKSGAQSMGGTAYLTMLSTEDEPFLSGLSFTAMPPTKRWRQMEALSGGEKTVAALALLFAIHSFHPSPFFVLDEVDAALDASNVAKVANYIRQKTRTEEGKEQFQAIVISLKDYFFSKADALVGVTKHPSQGCSQTFTLDLSQYGEPEQ